MSDIETELRPSVAAFLDIMAFRALLQSHQDDARWHIHVMNSFSDALSRSRSTLEEIESLPSPDPMKRQPWAPRVQMLSFADCVVISAEDRPGGMWRVAHATTILGIELAKKGLYCRGGIARGSVLYGDLSLIGLGIIKAVELEEKTAKYPRIVIADELAHQLENRFHTPNSDLTVSRGDDGCLFLDLFATLGQQSGGSRSLQDIYHDVCDLQERAHRSGDQTHVNCWRWLATLLRSRMTSLGLLESL